ncbi:ras-related protein Rab-37-like isoform X5 [Octopus sinensis]|uniref:Ras-related protein Rab-37-like isoform X5 n=1 Tax=Octopus sinensis TaxID=2607531 RepID=A0A7E6FRL5_9MOLL|nr:ras-related protein Rab-37-like isoform X5 [Octopus sinensis]
MRSLPTPTMLPLSQPNNNNNTILKSRRRQSYKKAVSLHHSFDVECFDVSCKNKVVDIDGTKIKLQIWDTAGQERFRSVTNAYYRDAHALLLLYDVTNKTSFDNIRAWLTEINEYAQEDVVIMLLGNKADMSGDKIVRREDGERLARDHNVAFMETSAKTGMNVDLAFMAIARDLKMKKLRKPDEPAFNVAEYIQQENTVKVGGCC